MQEDFVQLIYLSNAKPELKQAELDRILEVSRRNNPSRGITGLLVFANGVFIQVLEGPSTGVHKLFETICDDSRHQDVSMLGEYMVRKESSLNGRWDFFSQLSMNSHASLTLPI